MAIPHDFIYQRYEDDASYTILTSDLALTADLIDPKRNCVIYADILTLDSSKGNLVFPGRNVTVCCRSLNPNGTTISTQPQDPQKPAPSPKPRTSDDPAVNKGNPNALDGDPIAEEDFGHPGGNITILAGSIEQPLTLNSTGGKGHDGQQGGDAGQGADGVPEWHESRQSRGRW
ncbi:hypothetical protein CNMCM8694_002613 [Aspergillus lentulus]|nr:hypothetical protein CNMCM8060_002834 [Aspergillus lentulus]KAF4190983.1 hypothetical protein CNMCM8694_002613 [Aspergillus lentulus]